MTKHSIYTSLCRTSDLRETTVCIEALDREKWRSGDFIMSSIVHSSEDLLIELTDGRMITGMKGDQLIGCLGDRHATLEATGTWKEIGPDKEMHLLTGAGLLGKLTSKSPFVPELVRLDYEGHCTRNGSALNLKDFVIDCPSMLYEVPTIMIVGTSMSAGKTASAKVMIKFLKDQGLKVFGAKLTGAGRYRDILSMKDAGAFKILDFVDAGLPSSIVDRDTYLQALQNMLCRIAAASPDVAVVEIGASPLEPYNGSLAYAAVSKAIKCTVLCASDPYAVYGVMKAFNIKPDFVAGVATNTLGGVELIDKLCGVPAINLLNHEQRPKLQEILLSRLRS